MLNRVILFSVFIITICALQANATKQIINVQNFSFTPSSATINLGDTVEFVWITGTHTTTSTTIPAGAVSWAHDLNSQDGNASFTYVPAVTGTYNYHCTIHPTTMIGSFTVNSCVPPTAAQAMISAGGPTTVCKPNTVTLTVATAGLTYQWKKGTKVLAGKTNQSYVAAASGGYKCDVSNACGTTTSNTIQVTVNAQPAATITPSGTVNKCSTDHVILMANTGANLSYQWKKGANNVNGATNSSLDVVAAGKYKVVVTNSLTGCSKTSATTTVNNVCKTENINAAVSVYPNPSTTDFSFATSQLNTNGVVNIFDLTGQLLESMPFDHADVKAGADLKEGIYLAKIEVEGQSPVLFKLIKNL